MTLILDFDVTKTQVVSVKTDIETNYSIVCPLTCSLQPPPAYVSETGSTITAITALATTVDVGPHTISLYCASSNYPTFVTAKTYTFVLTVQHCIVNTLTLSPV